MQVDKGAGRAPGSTHLRVKQIAVMLDVHPSTIYRAIENGALKALRVGRGPHAGIRVSKAAYEEFLANGGAS
jgi:excisionase family DNA binding protein